MKAKPFRMSIAGLVASAVWAAPAMADDLVEGGFEAEVFAGPQTAFFVEETPYTMSEEDLALTWQAIERLQADDRIQGRVSVSALDGVLILQGGVRSVPMIYRAIELLQGMESVREVNVDGLDRDSYIVWRGS